jgi:hypothetical protein
MPADRVIIRHAIPGNTDLPCKPAERWVLCAGAVLSVTRNDENDGQAPVRARQPTLMLAASLACPGCGSMPCMTSPATLLCFYVADGASGVGVAVTWPGRDRYLIEVVAPASKCTVLECAIWPRWPHERLLEGWPPGGEHGVPGTNHSPPHFVWRAHILDTYAASGPEPATWKDPDPRRRSSRGSEGFRIGLPARRWRSRDACGLSRLNDSPWRYGLRRTCRPVTGRSYRPRSPWQIQNRLAHLAITHRYKRAHCLWLEQFQIADSLRLNS